MNKKDTFAMCGKLQWVAVVMYKGVGSFIVVIQGKAGSSCSPLACVKVINNNNIYKEAWEHSQIKNKIYISAMDSYNKDLWNLNDFIWLHILNKKMLSHYTVIMQRKQSLSKLKSIHLFTMNYQKMHWKYIDKIIYTNIQISKEPD